MQLKHILIFCIILLFTYNTTYSQSVINAADYGVTPNSVANAVAPIKKAIAACKAAKSKTLLLPGGRIDVWPDGAVKRELYISNCTEDDTLPKEKTVAFFFEDCHNLTLEGNNTLVVLHGKMVSFAILNSRNIRIKNISFDYERPTMSELTIQSVTASAVETDIHPDSKYNINNGRLQFFGEGWQTNAYHTIVYKPSTGKMLYSSFDAFVKSKAVETSPLHVRFEGDFTNNNFQPGDVLTIRDPYRDNCGGFISLSKDIALEHVNMYYMHGLGIVSQFSENISLLKVTAAPRENAGRIIASFADCFHFSGCKGLVSIDSCFTSGSHDDPINIHGTHLQITRLGAAHTITVRFMHPQTYGFPAFFAGDSIAFTNPQTLLPVAVAKLKAAKLTSKREMQLVVEGQLPLNIKAGLCIENLTCTPAVVIKNSRFERTNTRGLLITTRRKVVIENNTFFRTGMYPILIADDALSWYESGPVQDLTINNNTFIECGYNTGSGAITIAPENHTLVAGKVVHRNITITNNSFTVNNNAVLAARSVGNLVFTGNRINLNGGGMANDTSLAAIALTACKKVLIEKNSFNFPHPPVVSAIKMANTDVKTGLRVHFLP